MVAKNAISSKSDLHLELIPGGRVLNVDFFQCVGGFKCAFGKGCEGGQSAVFLGCYDVKI